MFYANASAIHFVFKIFHRWAVVMPDDAGSSGAASHDFIGEKWMDVVNGVNLRSGCIGPGKTKRSKTPFHLVKYKHCLGKKSIRACIAESNGAVAIASLTLRRLAAARDYERGGVIIG